MTLPDKQLFTGDMVLKLKENMPAIMNNEPDPDFVDVDEKATAQKGWDLLDGLMTENGTLPVVMLLHGKRCRCCGKAWDQIDILKAEIRRLKAQGEK